MGLIGVLGLISVEKNCFFQLLNNLIGMSRDLPRMRSQTKMPLVQAKIYPQMGDVCSNVHDVETNESTKF